jgi:hypothetical protein
VHEAASSKLASVRLCPQIKPGRQCLRVKLIYLILSSSRLYVLAQHWPIKVGCSTEHAGICLKPLWGMKLHLGSSFTISHTAAIFYIVGRMHMYSSTHSSILWRTIYRYCCNDEHCAGHECLDGPGVWMTYIPTWNSRRKG